MTATTELVRPEAPRATVPDVRPAVIPVSAPETGAPSGALTAEKLLAVALAAATEDPDVAADAVFAGAHGRRDTLSAAASLLIQRLKLRSDDQAASLALRIVEKALVRAPYPDGPWRWAENISPRRQRSADRRRRRAIRRRRAGPRLPNRAVWRSQAPRARR